MGSKAAVVVAAALVAACGSSGSGGSGGSGGSAGADAAAGSGGQSGGAGQDGGAGAAGSEGGCTPGTATLQNDGFVNNSQVAFEGGFAAGECWGATFYPDACTFDIQSALVIVGGGDAGNVDVTVSVWDVDGTGKPVTQHGSTQATITGASDVMSEIPLGTLSLPSRDGTPFAISMCQAHDGLPSIGRDSDGTTPGRDWIYTNNQWVEASTLGVQGDWILRAKISRK